MAAPICHFEIFTKDTKKAEDFFGNLFGWKFSHEMGDDYPFIDTGSDPGGALVKNPDFTPGGGTGFYFHVDDCAGVLEKAVSLGGKKIRDKTEIPEHGWYAHFEDLDGNTIGLFEALKK